MGKALLLVAALVPAVHVASSHHTPSHHLPQSWQMIPHISHAAAKEIVHPKEHKPPRHRLRIATMIVDLNNMK